MSEALLQTRGLTKKYGETTALNQVSLTLRQGDIYGLVGRNGAGKTTFFKCVMGLAQATAGEIEIGGEKSSLNTARRKIGFMINASSFSYLNPRQNLNYLCRAKGIRPQNEVDRLLRLVQLDGVKKPFKAFSMGMKQRLGIAGALLGSPLIVVLDEPINGLDPQGIADIRAVIQRENQEHGTTFIVSSHILSELDLVATRFGFIEQGCLLQEITHTALHERTQKSLVVEVNDPAKALELLRTQLGITGAATDGRSLLLESHFDRPQEIARVLVSAGVELFRLAPQETTLEEYFMRLVGGRDA
ncbi:MAG: ABC transporter ATP-binding protein [Oscillospiraceae bacterium]|jgi:ABC-2 type transport system ATP-binding protein|nr:ABC transporter ATP-binding protein [Oscillospiraceae bacterium]